MKAAAISMVTIADTAIVPTPTEATTFGRMRDPRIESTSAPAKGTAATSQRSCNMSASHPAEGIGIERFVLMMEFQNEREPHRHLRCSHRQNEKKNYLSVRLPPSRSRHHKRQPGGVQHHL